jgi:hypothetical protein
VLAKRLLVVVAVALAISMATVGCGSSNSQSDGGAFPVGNSPAGSSGSGEAGSDWVLTGDDAVWPDYIPADIPPLQGDISQVMQGSVSIRIFYENLSKDQVAGYLQVLQDDGFALEYAVYAEEGTPDNPEERISEGDFDAVNITKDNYRMTLEPGEDVTTLDIQTSGFEDVYPFTPDSDWPADLADVVPEPERCSIEGVYPQESGGYQIVLRPDDDTAIADYVQALLDLGYAPKDSPIMGRPDAASDYQDVYGRDDVEVTVDYSRSVSAMRLTIWRLDALASPGWPPELVGVVPQPDESVLKTVVELGDLDWIVTCAGSGGLLMPSYAEQLLADGFSETGRTQASDGSLATVSLEKEGVKVDLSLDATGQLRIDVTDEP